jgi:hypothetical protein
MVVALGAELGVAVPTPSELADAAVTPPAKDHAQLPTTPAAASGTPADDASLRLAIASNIFAGGGTVRFDELIGELRPGPSLLIAAACAAKLGIADGDLVDVTAGERAIRGLRVRLDAGAPADVVAVFDGIPDAQANALADGESVAIANVRKPTAAAAAGGRT